MGFNSGFKGLTKPHICTFNSGDSLEPTSFLDALYLYLYLSVNKGTFSRVLVM